MRLLAGVLIGVIGTIATLIAALDGAFLRLLSQEDDADTDDDPHDTMIRPPAKESAP